MVIDAQWKDHLLSIDHLKEGIGLRGYGQRDPLTEYKREAFDLFQAMVERVKGAVVERLFKVQVERESQVELPIMTRDARRPASHAANRRRPPPRWPPPAQRRLAPPRGRRWVTRWAATTRVPAGRGRNTSGAVT